MFNPFSRHPVQIAMEIGALDELAQGRTRLGLGSGLRPPLERMGLDTRRSLTALREATEIIRGLLRGDEMRFSGTIFRLDGVKLDYRPRADIPIYMAARGPQSIKVCGELADGLIVSNMCTADFVAKSVASLHEAARTAGRTDRLAVVQYTPCVPGADRDAAFRAAKRAVADMLPAYWTLGQRLPDAKAALMDGSGIAEAEFQSAVARLKAGETPDTVLDDRYVTAFAIAGTIEDCLAQAAIRAEAGVTELALTFFGPSAAADMAFIGPAFAGK